MTRSFAPDSVTGIALDTPDWCRREAEKCFLLAEKVTDDKAADALLIYGSELLARAERMEET